MSLESLVSKLDKYRLLHFIVFTSTSLFLILKSRLFSISCPQFKWKEAYLNFEKAKKEKVIPNFDLDDIEFTIGAPKFKILPLKSFIFIFEKITLPFEEMRANVNIAMHFTNFNQVAVMDHSSDILKLNI